VAGDEDRGSLEVTSQPEGASVYVEGFLAGKSPVTLKALPPGAYRVVLKAEGRADHAVDVRVEKNATARVSAELPAEGFRSTVRAEEDDKVVTGKEARKPFENAKGTRKLGAYAVLEVASFLTRSAEPMAPEHLYSLLADLARALDRQTAFSSFVTNYTAGPSPRWKQAEPEPGARVLVLSGVITEYDKGSQATRYMVGFGAGKTRAYCQFRLVDKATGEVLLERIENGSVSMGLFGGSSSGAMKELGEDIAKAIRANW
jgi:hypothetical protein